MVASPSPDGIQDSLHIFTPVVASPSPDGV